MTTDLFRRHKLIRENRKQEVREMLVRKGNAFYEIDEECMQEKRTLQISGENRKENRIRKTSGQESSPPERRTV